MTIVTPLKWSYHESLTQKHKMFKRSGFPKGTRPVCNICNSTAQVVMKGI
jgi:hypothetical protein